MRPIQMVDLQIQYERLKPRIDAAVQEVMASAAFIQGPAVKQFQADLEAYLEVPHVIPCANGTDALQIAMMALELKPGDEVIVPSFTYVATAEVIALLGLVPVMVDVLPNTFNIDPQQIEPCITPKTKAIVPVHLFGQSADMESVLAIAEKYGLFVIEDTAQALGSDYTFSNGRKQKAGTMGHLGATSFFPSKNLGCYGDGGAIITQDENLAHKCRMIANHGQSKKYYHDSIGVNSRLDTVQAAILKIKLEELNTYNQLRRKAADFYDAALKDCEQFVTPYRDPNSTHVFHQYTLQCMGIDRDVLKAQLEQHQIPSMIYYPVPLHRQKAYAHQFPAHRRLPETELLTQRVLSLPMHPDLDLEQLEYIVNFVRALSLSPST